MKEYVYSGKGERLSKFLVSLFPNFGYNRIMNFILSKKVKVDGKRISKDLVLSGGEVLNLFFSTEESATVENSLKVYYQSKDITVFFKPRGTSSESFSERVIKSFPDLILTHRLDTNTEGLIIFSANQNVFNIMKDAFKRHYINKTYLALVSGKVIAKERLTGFLLKNADKGEVKIFSQPTNGATPIITEINPIGEREGNLTLIEVNLVTGKTHQIRAHLAFCSHPIVGDTKYGDFSLNKKENKAKQCLSAVKLSFSFPENSPLFYLNKVEVKAKADFN